MTPKQEAFVREYLIDLNATQAAIRAGYSARTANEQGARLLAHVSVRSAVQDGVSQRAERTEITADRVLKELARIAFFDIRKLYAEDGTMKLPTELDDDTAAALVGIDIQESVSGQEGGPIITTRKAKVIDRTAALTLAMRHLGMLTDKLEVADVTDRAAQMRASKAKRLGQS
jgi:phage terminase small subunit